MSVSIGDVEKIGKLAKLSFSEDEKKKFVAQFNQILQYIANRSENLQKAEIIPDDIKQKLNVYNMKLHGVKPKQNIKRYYQLKPSGYSDASFLFFLKGKNNETG